MDCWDIAPDSRHARRRSIPPPSRLDAYGTSMHHKEPHLGTATIRDVARQAKVSLKTVSRVINRESSVRDETRERVLRAIEQLDYRPDLSARSLRSSKAYAIGLVYDNPNPYYIIAVQQGALAACREMGFGLQIHPCDSRAPKLAEELRDLAHRSRLAGLVLAPPMSERMPLLRELAAYNIPIGSGWCTTTPIPTTSSPCSRVRWPHAAKWDSACRSTPAIRARRSWPKSCATSRTAPGLPVWCWRRRCPSACRCCASWPLTTFRWCA